MTTPTQSDADAPPDPRACGQRIEQLLQASSTAGPLVRERSEELLRVVLELYGAGIERLLDLVFDAGALDDDMLTRLAGDDLVASLLLVHGLHPYGVERRVEDALIKVRPYLGSHGGDVELVGVSPDGVVKLRMLGSCDGCPSSSVTLKLAVEDAIEAAAPEVVRIEVEEGHEENAVTYGTVIPIDALTSRLPDRIPAAQAAADTVARWEPISEAEDIPTGGLKHVTIAGAEVVLCRIGSQVYAYRSGCPSCAADLADGVIERRLGGSRNSAVLTCPKCRSHFDVQQAGIGLDGGNLHLEPMPILERDGVLQVAVTSSVPA